MFSAVWHAQSSRFCHLQQKRQRTLEKNNNPTHGGQSRWASIGEHEAPQHVVSSRGWERVLLFLFTLLVPGRICVCVCVRRGGGGRDSSKPLNSICEFQSGGNMEAAGVNSTGVKCWDLNFSFDAPVNLPFLRFRSLKTCFMWESAG